MKNFIIVSLGVLFVFSIVICIVGILTAAVIPWFGGIRADRIGEIGMSLAIAGECTAWLLGPALMRVLDTPDRRKTLGLPGTKKYGNRKPMT